jgi:hypothetical protein
LTNYLQNNRLSIIKKCYISNQEGIITNKSYFLIHEAVDGHIGVRSLHNLKVQLLTQQTAHILTTRNCILRSGDTVLVNEEEQSAISERCNDCFYKTLLTKTGKIMSTEKCICVDSVMIIDNEQHLKEELLSPVQLQLV